jgi:hypothetical protein
MRSFKRWIAPVLFLLLCCAVTACLNYALIPISPLRITLHELRSEGDYDTIFLGTSHGQYGIDPASVDETSGGKSLSLCLASAYLDDSYYLLQLACETQTPSTVVYELDPSYWMNEQWGGSTKISFYKDFPPSRAKTAYFFDKILSLDFRYALAPWSYYRNRIGEIPKTLRDKRSDAYQNYDPSLLEIPLCRYEGRGFLYRERFEGEDKGTFNHIPWEEAKVKDLAVSYFKKLASFCREKQIRLIVITTPVPEETVAYSLDAYRASDAWFSAFLQEQGVEYYNFNRLRPDLLDRSMTGYWDYDGHMDGILAQDFSRLLGRLLKDLSDGAFEYDRYFEEEISSH